MTPNILSRLNIFIEENRSFAIYRTPGSDNAHFIAQEQGALQQLPSIESLNGQSGFVIAPFEISGHSPLVLIRPDREECIQLPAVDPIGFQGSNGHIHPPVKIDQAYADRFYTCLSTLKEQRFRKLVLSREKSIERETNFSPAEAFLLACSRYVRSYVYLFHTPATGTWLGCTPEILLAGEKERWQTVALAGTQALRQGTLPDVWNNKNLMEQMLVTYYIRKQLAAFGVQPQEKGPYTVIAGELAHLKTDFHFDLGDTGQLGDLLNLLHPTPAVSGLPKAAARRFILANEGYDRLYYSGFVGSLNPQGKSDLYVNLRCMNILEHSLKLYAGGGLLPTSNLADEWQETEDKMQTMLFVAKNRLIQTPQYVFK
ncbi:MAG: isochorismate synthase [Clostridiales bacterium]|jgi:isochorismate synthase|nr:isochorismate synthase [Clostridiales bacterium]